MIRVLLLATSLLILGCGSRYTVDSENLDTASPSMIEENLTKTGSLTVYMGEYGQSIHEKIGVLEFLPNNVFTYNVSDEYQTSTHKIKNDYTIRGSYKVLPSGTHKSCDDGSFVKPRYISFSGKDGNGKSYSATGLLVVMAPDNIYLSGCEDVFRVFQIPTIENIF